MKWTWPDHTSLFPIPITHHSFDHQMYYHDLITSQYICYISINIIYQSIYMLWIWFCYFLYMAIQYTEYLLNRTYSNKILTSGSSYIHYCKKKKSSLRYNKCCCQEVAGPMLSWPMNWSAGRSLWSLYRRAWSLFCIGIMPGATSAIKKSDTVVPRFTNYSLYEQTASWT